MPSSIKHSPLDIIIVGAGIAGFAAAISCRRAGHHVEIYERSALNNELGAAIHVCPNASRGLLAWGLDPVQAQFVTCKRSYRAHGSTLVRFHEGDDTYVTEKFGAPWFFAHRVDLHEELKRLATRQDGEGRPAVVHLKSEVTRYDTAAGSVSLSSGETVFGDLVIAADGVHTGSVEAILGSPNPALPTTDYNFAYRFLIPTEELAADPETVQFTEDDDGRVKFFVGEGRRLVWYPCRDNKVHNFVAIFHSDEQVYREDWQTHVETSALLETYSAFHPSLLAVLKKAKDVKQWPLLFRAPISSWHKEKLVAIGDAAHPMLPHQGQGGAQAIEDAVALGIALSGCTPANLDRRLKVFESVRMNRASVMQIFSIRSRGKMLTSNADAGQDEPEKIRTDAAKFMPAETVPKTPEEFFAYNFGYDVVRDSVQAMQREDASWELPANFFERTPVAGVYPSLEREVDVDGDSIAKSRLLDSGNGGRHLVTYAADVYHSVVRQVWRILKSAQYLA
ncbi:salicylate hydroxylase [Drepanopeziza brunnea f. sp. 'multigermtubi' MB_m1]|uniref:Salicylate hydroxylase n=1 Tax=Marssonina brunnea f. sp. multigermtubi (strain MB_m1) TaxID=1072389 RepID=K1Y5N9_MARBU|nr:salicylate hydroxylase [Drepanopeziza brunnea f. sp. 'multigermtubi' MB_m1]EKD20524.1 salicylate hydroxylase [Drepanopeziza brunnea f. sp. 'multigermtubi' MB_m1]